MTPSSDISMSLHGFFNSANILIRPPLLQNQKSSSLRTQNQSESNHIPNALSKSLARWLLKSRLTYSNQSAGKRRMYSARVHGLASHAKRTCITRRKQEKKLTNIFLEENGRALAHYTTPILSLFPLANS